MNKRSDHMNMRRLAALFAFILAFALVIPGLTMKAKAEAKNVDVKIASFEIQNVKEEKVDKIFFGDTFHKNYGILGSNKAAEDRIKLFPENCDMFVEKIQKNIKDATH